MPSAITDLQPQPADATTSLQPLCHILTPVGCLGFGVDEDICDAELARLTQTNVPTAIILDSVSTDSGPQKLALGTTSAPRSAYVRDLGKLLRLVQRYGVPLLFSSAGGDGSGKHVDEMVEVVREVQEASESNFKTKCLAVYADVPKAVVRERLVAGRISGNCGPAVPTMTDDDIEGAPKIVGQMGAEPFIDAMYAEPDFNVIVGGRAYDPAAFVAFMAYTAMRATRKPLSELPKSALGGLFHIGKILECGAQCTIPKTRAASATIYADGTFDVTPLEPGVRCTALSVAAHTLYEKTRPDLLHGPGECLNLIESTYVELEDGKTVRSTGARFQHALAGEGPYAVKLEGARNRGHRSLFIGAFRDSVLTGQIDDFFQRFQAYVKQQHKHYASEDWDLCLHKLGAYDPAPPGEVCVVGEALGATQEIANSVSNTARVACIHGPYPGQKATSGNLALGIGGKREIEAGPCSEFCIYHVMNLTAGEEGAQQIDTSPIQAGRFIAPRSSDPLFSWRQVTVGGASKPEPTTTSEKPLLTILKPLQHTPASKLTNSHSSSSSSSTTTTPDLAHQLISTLGAAAQVIRSKNAGPYEITFDILFESPHTYKLIKSSGLLTAETVATLYGIPVADAIYSDFFDQALAFKATIPRMMDGKRSVSGNFRDEDVHGSQKYLPLVRLPLPEGLVDKLQTAARLYRGHVMVRRVGLGRFVV